MRSVWSGNLAFGLVSIPVKLGSAVSSHKVGFRQIHLADQGRVRYQKTCELDEEVLTASDIGRAYETPDDQLVQVTDSDLRSLPLPTAKTIEVSGFVDLASVDSMQLDTPYFLAPASAGANRPYVLMREALERSGKAAVGKFAMRNSEHLALVMPRDDVLLLQTLRWPDELGNPAEAAPKGSVKISDSELKLADTLIEALGEADLTAYHDEYAQAVEALVTAKLEGAEPPTVGEEAGGGNVVDLMAALRASVEQAKPSGGRAGSGGRSGSGSGGRSGGARKAASGKRAGTKKAAAKSDGSGAGTSKAAGSTSGAAKKTASRKTASSGRKAS
ncbi:putative Ku70/Ku80 protein [Actinacidiphila reveromycinica]|uniref:Non-homologous end joining protein Ku n=1 Tax=Actinacidiphila reveromycinica TaxID=659352 RepID=A0A7U3UZS1_9ACTN|nr:Ku protein [Streptomyces sp. SN-593]BBB01844.1 putative Ku70/Ku80 protein [Streptomyces sp. SN-593]